MNLRHVAAYVVKARSKSLAVVEAQARADRDQALEAAQAATTLLRAKQLALDDAALARADADAELQQLAYDRLEAEADKKRRRRE